MSRSSDEGDQRKGDSSIRMWAEPQPGPSRCQPSRQGYCGYCRVLYSHLDQHLSSLRHLDSVRASAQGSSSAFPSSSRTKLTLLERFLQDVLQHHPHRYDDPRPSHADLPSVSAPLLPREELDEVCCSDDSQSLETREHLSSSDDASCPPANQQVEDSPTSQSGEGTAQGTAMSGPLHTQTTPPVHRKAHRKTNRRKTGSSPSSSAPQQVSHPGLQTLKGPWSSLSPPPTADPRPPSSLGLGTGPGPPPALPPPLPVAPDPPLGLRPWLSWQRERRAAAKDEAFSSEHSDALDRTIDEVIQACCHGDGSTSCQQEEAESFHFSLPVSMETQSDNWDSPVQRPHTPVQVGRRAGRDLSRLMDVQVELQDQVYSCQLDSALHKKQVAKGGVSPGYWNLPIEEILPTPEHLPESFRGKTWAQVQQEDEDKVEHLVRQFRRERFTCYFDSESLARYGRSHKKGHGEKRAGPDPDVLPLFDHVEEEVSVRRRGRGPRRRGQSFRLASRCQVVKVSHATQTIRLVVPAVRQESSEALPTGIPAANQDAAERTPEVRRCLPSSYSHILTPLQPRTSVLYLLCSGPAHTSTPAPDSTSKRCRKKRRPLDLQGLKVTYKRLPVKFYDSCSNRVLKNPPKGLSWRSGSAPSSPPPPCVRQLFRSLSPDLNTDRPEGGASASCRVKGQRSSPQLLLSTLSKEAAQTVSRRGMTSKAPPPTPYSRGRGGRRERTRPQFSFRRTRAQATPPKPRREGLRRAGPAQTLARQGRGRRGRGSDRSHR